MDKLMECERMTWKDIVKQQDLSDAQKRSLSEGVKKTGVCPRCKESVVLYSMCPLNLKEYPARPSCPMKQKEQSRARGFPTKLD